MAYDGVARRAYYRKNADRIKAYNRRWRQSRRLTHPEESVRQNDHITPAMHGGLNEKANLQKLCRSCHMAKTKRERAVRVDVVAAAPTQMRFF